MRYWYWYKYLVSDNVDEASGQPISTTFADHERDIGGFQETEFYSSEEAFFNRYYFGEWGRRIQNYGQFLSKRVATDQLVLSLGSGRCANERTLLDDGYRVTCSDLERPEAYAATKRIFPGWST